MQELAIEENVRAIEYINDPTEEMMIKALKLDGLI